MGLQLRVGKILREEPASRHGVNPYHRQDPHETKEKRRPVNNRIKNLQIFHPPPTLLLPRKPAWLIWRNAVAVRQVARIDRKVDTVGQARLLMTITSCQPAFLADMPAGQRQAATSSATPTLTLTHSVTGANVARTEHVQQGSPHNPPSQLNPYRECRFFVGHIICRKMLRNCDE